MKNTKMALMNSGSVGASHKSAYAVSLVVVVNHFDVEGFQPMAVLPNDYIRHGKK